MLMAALAGERGKLRRAVEGGHAALREKLCAALVSAGRDHLGRPGRRLLRRGRRRRGRAARSRRRRLPRGSVTDRERGATLAAWCAAPQQRRQMLDAYAEAYLTDKGEIRKIG